MKLKKFICIFSLCIAILLPSITMFCDDSNDDENIETTFSQETLPCVTAPNIDAHAAIVIDMQSGRVLFEKNGYSKLPMASTTKIMTAIVALENSNLTDTVEVSERASQIRGSIIHLKKGQKFQMEELLYGLMLRSGNDAAIAIAEHIGGTVQGFLDMMNKKALKIGARNTSFKSPHGLDADGHFTTAYDLALITKYALNNPILSKIVSTRTANVNGKMVTNTNEMLGIYSGADGVKTGYTGQAGRCLVTSATRNGNRYISVVLNCATRTKRAQNSKIILDYAFSNYRNHALVKKDDLLYDISLIKGLKPNVMLSAKKTITLPMREDEIAKIETEALYTNILQAPVRKGDDAGTVKYMLDGKVIGQTNLVITETIDRKDFWYYMGSIIRSWFKVAREGIFAQ